MSNSGFSAYSLTSLALILVLSTSHSPHHPAPVSYQLPTTMPGPKNFQIPSLSTFAKISCFCNPKATTSIAIMCNTLLWSVILELLENVKTKAFDEGRKEGYEKGYNKGRYMANKNECRDEEEACNTAFEEGKKLGRGEVLENKKNVEECMYKNSWREGHETRLEEGKEEQEAI